MRPVEKVEEKTITYRRLVDPAIHQLRSSLIALNSEVRLDFCWIDLLQTIAHTKKVFRNNNSNAETQRFSMWLIGSLLKQNNSFYRTQKVNIWIFNDHRSIKRRIVWGRIFLAFLNAQSERRICVLSMFGRLRVSAESEIAGDEKAMAGALHWRDGAKRDLKSGRLRFVEIRWWFDRKRLLT